MVYYHLNFFVACNLLESFLIYIYIYIYKFSLFSFTCGALLLQCIGMNLFFIRPR